MEADIALVRRLAHAEHGLAVVATTREDAGVQASVVNAAVIDHPRTGDPVVAFVARGRTRKLANLRRRPRLTLVLRHQWDWVSVEGRVELAGPDDDDLGLGAEGVRLLLRQIFTAAGGTHDDMGEYDRVMLLERRTAVLVHCERLVTNPPHARHLDR